MTNAWTGGQYSVYRSIFGVYLAIHYFRLMAWGEELFSNKGLLPISSLSPLAHLFPNVLAVWDSPFFVQALLLTAACLSLLFAIGLWDRAAACLLWYLGACFLGRDPLISNPALPYIGWLLLAHMFLPQAPYGSLTAGIRGKSNDDWRMTPSIYLAAWIVMALGYTYSGVMKLTSPSWCDGSALERILSNPLARPGHLRLCLLALPPALLKCATWGTLGLEIAFAPLALSRRARPWTWGAMLCLHLGLLLLISFPDLTAGMVLLHLFTFDPSWLRTSKRVFHVGLRRGRDANASEALAPSIPIGDEMPNASRGGGSPPARFGLGFSIKFSPTKFPKSTIDHHVISRHIGHASP